MKFLIFRWIPSVAVTGMGIMLASQPAARSAGSFTDLNIEYGEIKLALDAALAENKQLRETIAETGKALADARQCLVETTNDVAIFKAQTLQMKLRMEALGIGVVAGGSPKLEQRLLSAVNHLRAASLKRDRVAEALVRLTEAAGLYVKAEPSQSADSRLTLESEVRNSNSILLTEAIAPDAQAGVPSIEDGQVISIKANLSLVVVNLGFSSGVKLGMPLQIVRNQQVIGRIKVVDVREKIAGAVIQDLVSQKKTFVIGDRIKIVTE